MAKPRVFISSTFYDLKNVRGDLERFVRTMGYEPVLNERGGIPYERTETLEEYCYKELQNVDIMVAIIGGRFGSESHRSKQYSVSQLEFKTAHELNKQIYTFIEKAVYHEYQTYQSNLDVEGFQVTHVNDRRIHEFIHEVAALQRNNVIHPFEHSAEISEFLKQQWAGLLREYLDNRERGFQNTLLERLQATANTLQDLVKLVSRDKRTQENAVKEILLANHPLFQRIKEAAKVSYRPRFQFAAEMVDWFDDVGWKQVDTSEYDSEVYSFEEKHGGGGYGGYGEPARKVRVARELFDEGGYLKPVREEEWQDSWVERHEPVALESSEDDDIPF